MMTIKNCQYLELLRYRKRKSYDNLHDLILKRESFYFDRPEFVFLFSSFFFLSKMFLHHVAGGKVKVVFFLENC